MSYILDALKKSEQQRQQGAAPMIRLAQAGEATPRRSAIPLNGAIALVLIAVGITIGWLRPWQQETNVPTPAPVAAHAPAPGTAFAMPAPDPVAFERNEPPRPPSVASPMASGAAKTAAVEATAPEPAETAAVNAAPASAESPTSAPEMPGLTISMHGYSSDPKDRMVMINGKLLREGEYLSADLRLIQVTPDGVLVDYKGNRFQRARR